MGKFGEADDLTKKLGDEKDPLKRRDIARQLEGAQKRGFGENVMGGAKEHFMGKLGNLGIGEDGFSMKTLMDSQKARAGQEGGIPTPPALTAPAMQMMQPTNPSLAYQQPQIPGVPTMAGVGPSPAMQTIQAAAQQGQQMAQMPMSGGLLSMLDTPSPTGALNVPAGQTSARDRLEQAAKMMYAAG